jgi:hypothetical protein
MTEPEKIAADKLSELQTLLAEILQVLKNLEERWVHSESNARFGIETMKDIARHVRNISLELSGH